MGTGRCRSATSPDTARHRLGQHRSGLQPPDQVASGDPTCGICHRSARVVSAVGTRSRSTHWDLGTLLCAVRAGSPQMVPTSPGDEDSGDACFTHVETEVKEVGCLGAQGSLRRPAQPVCPPHLPDAGHLPSQLGAPPWPLQTGPPSRTHGLHTPSPGQASGAPRAGLCNPGCHGRGPVRATEAGATLVHPESGGLQRARPGAGAQC